MQSFLDKTADYIIQNYRNSISDICIVLPNRRAGVFLKTILAEKINAPFWSPDVFSTEDFISEVSDLQLADQTTLLFGLYKSYKEVEQEKAQPFDEFANWGTILLQDYNEIDRYLINHTQLFDYLSESRALAVWNPGKPELTEFQREYLKFWNQLKAYYECFHKNLADQKLAYQGMAFRQTADNIENIAANIRWKKVIFAGFNALNACEEKIFFHLVKTQAADILWDADDYYVNNTAQEAGRFLRKHKNNWNFKDANNQPLQFKWQENNFLTSAKEIEVIGVAKNVGQAKVASAIIEELAQQNNLKHSALVLADENLLLPVISSLPNNIEKANVTMGFGLKNSIVSSLIDGIFNLHKCAKRNSENELVFYYKDLLKILGNPLLVSALKPSSAVHNNFSIVSLIVDYNHSFLTRKNILELLTPFDLQEEIKLIFNDFNDSPAELLPALGNLYSFLFSIVREKDGDAVNQQFLAEVIKINNKFSDILLQFEESINLTTFINLYRQFISGTTIPFLGEPLDGLQVMGVLETRTLDFENLVMLSVNEEILPSGKSNNSFIPYDIKREFGLPGYTEKDAIFAFHFYRLLQKAKNIYLIYNTEPDEMGSGEKSRFITQLIEELPKANPKVIISEKIYSVPVSSNKAASIEIKKDAAILEKLDQIAQKGFSPSSLNTYKNCSLQFYFNSVANLRAEEEVEETVDAAALGTIIHQVLETLYKPFEGKIISPAAIDSLLKEAEKTTENAFITNLSTHKVLTGKNLLIQKVALRFILNFLQHEKEFLLKLQKEGKLLTIHSLEHSLISSLVIEGKEVIIKGNADRIDSISEIPRIIDYKTGKVEKKELMVEDFSELNTNTNLNKSFQLLMYAYLYSKNNQQHEKFNSGIITFRNISSGLNKVCIGSSDAELTKEDLNSFEAALNNLLKEILCKETSFTQTSVLATCSYCDYANICNRA